MKICICGTAPDSMHAGPYGNDEWDVWACSPGTIAYIPNIKVFFELHRWLPGSVSFPEIHCEFLRKFEGEVIMSEHVPEVPGCSLLPVDHLVAKYGEYFFTSSLAWMLAMAIEQEPEHIALFGVDMAAETEYTDQRLGVQYFAQIAKQKGIQIGVPPESDLFRPAPLYGVCQTSHVWIKQSKRLQDYEIKLAEAEQRLAVAQIDTGFFRGAINDLKWNMKSWSGGKGSLGQEFVTVPNLPAILAPKIHEKLPITMEQLRKARDVLNAAEVDTNTGFTGDLSDPQMGELHELPSKEAARRLKAKASYGNAVKEGYNKKKKTKKKTKRK